MGKKNGIFSRFFKKKKDLVEEEETGKKRGFSNSYEIKNGELVSKMDDGQYSPRSYVHFEKKDYERIAYELCYNKDVLKFLKMICADEGIVDDVAMVIMKISEFFEAPTMLFHILLSMDFENGNEREIMGDDSFSTKIMDYFLAEDRFHRFLKEVIMVTIADLLKEEPIEEFSLEIDPLNVENSSIEKIEKNCEQLISYLERILDTVFSDDTIMQMPFEIRFICKRIDLLAKTFDPDDEKFGNRLIANFIVFRVINASILAPDLKNFISATVHPNQRRNLMLITSALSHIALEKLYDENDAAMMKLNPTIEKYMQPMKQFLQRLSPDDSIIIMHMKREEDSLKKKLEEKLISKGEEKLIEQIERILHEILKHKDEFKEAFSCSDDGLRLFLINGVIPERILETSNGEVNDNDDQVTDQGVANEDSINIELVENEMEGYESGDEYKQVSEPNENEQSHPNAFEKQSTFNVNSNSEHEPIQVVGEIKKSSISNSENEKESNPDSEMKLSPATDRKVSDSEEHEYSEKDGNLSEISSLSTARERDPEELNSMFFPQHSSKVPSQEDIHILEAHLKEMTSRYHQQLLYIQSLESENRTLKKKSRHFDETEKLKHFELELKEREEKLLAREKELQQRLNAEFPVGVTCSVKVGNTIYEGLIQKQETSNHSSPVVNGNFSSAKSFSSEPPTVSHHFPDHQHLSSELVESEEEINPYVEILSNDEDETKAPNHLDDNEIDKFDHSDFDEDHDYDNGDNVIQNEDAINSEDHGQDHDRDEDEVENYDSEQQNQSSSDDGELQRDDEKRVQSNDSREEANSDEDRVRTYIAALEKVCKMKSTDEMKPIIENGGIERIFKISSKYSTSNDEVLESVAKALSHLIIHDGAACSEKISNYHGTDILLHALLRSGLNTKILILSSLQTMLSFQSTVEAINADENTDILPNSMLNMMTKFPELPAETMKKLLLDHIDIIQQCGYDPEIPVLMIQSLYGGLVQTLKVNNFEYFKVILQILNYMSQPSSVAVPGPNYASEPFEIKSQQSVMKSKCLKALLNIFHGLLRSELSKQNESEELFVLLIDTLDNHVDENVELETLIQSNGLTHCFSCARMFLTKRETKEGYHLSGVLVRIIYFLEKLSQKIFYNLELKQKFNAGLDVLLSSTAVLNDSFDGENNHTLKDYLMFKKSVYKIMTELFLPLSEEMKTESGFKVEVDMIKQFNRFSGLIFLLNGIQECVLEKIRISPQRFVKHEAYWNSLLNQVLLVIQLASQHSGMIDPEQIEQLRLPPLMEEVLEQYKGNLDIESKAHKLTDIFS